MGREERGFKRGKRRKRVLYGEWREQDWEDLEDWGHKG